MPRERRPVWQAPERAFFVDRKVPTAGDRRRWLGLNPAIGLTIALVVCIVLAYSNLDAVLPLAVTAPEEAMAAAEAANRWVEVPEATVVARGPGFYRVRFVGTHANGSAAFVETDVLPGGGVLRTQLRFGDPRPGRREGFWLPVIGAVICVATLWVFRGRFVAARRPPKRQSQYRPYRPLGKT